MILDMVLLFAIDRAGREEFEHRVPGLRLFAIRLGANRAIPYHAFEQRLGSILSETTIDCKIGFNHAISFALSRLILGELRGLGKF